MSMPMPNSLFAHSRLLREHPCPHQTPVDALRRLINRKHGLKLNNYHELHRYSIETYAFWIDLWEFLGIISSAPPDPLQIMTSGRIPELPRWFPKCRLNYAENLLYRCDDGVAITAANESGLVKDYTFRELRERTRQIAAAFVANGIQSGDRVAAIAASSFTMVATALAVISVGGIFSISATDMAPEGILDRYRQIRPRFILADTEVQQAGIAVNLLSKIGEIAHDLCANGLQKAILLASAISGRDLPHLIPNSMTLSAFLSSGDSDRPLTFAQLPFDHPLYILYSSGTSGKPKCIVHSAGGALLQAKKDMKLGFSLGPEDTFFIQSTTGWILWSYLLNGLSVGSRIILYDGSPSYPNVPTFLKLVSDQGVTVWGTSPRFLMEIMGQGIMPLRDIGHFEGLRTMGVFGSVLTVPMFEWTQRAFGAEVHIVSTCGGTDIYSSFVTGTPILPVYAGEIQAKTLGMKVEVFDEDGKNIEHTGGSGELVCTRPHPSLPLFFWGDENNQQLRNAYFDIYPGVWRQGDFAAVNPTTKGIIVSGRSDGVLNPQGLRFGSGEIYSVMEKFSAHIEDSLCVGQRRSQDPDERVLLFLKMRTGQDLTDDLVESINTGIKKARSAQHVPSRIYAVDEIPYTTSGKKIEVAVKKIVSGYDIEPNAAVANPQSLQLYYKFRDIDRVQTKQ